MGRTATTERNLFGDRADEDLAGTPDGIDEPNPQRRPKSNSGSTSNDPAPVGGGGGLVRLTVNLTPRAFEALEQSSKRTGDSKTDTVNRALCVYALINELSDDAHGGGRLTVVNKHGEKETIHIV